MLQRQNKFHNQPKLQIYLLCLLWYVTNVSHAWTLVQKAKRNKLYSELFSMEQTDFIYA